MESRVFSSVLTSVDPATLTIDTIKVHDFIDYQADPHLMAHINNEKFLFADKLKKINQYEWSQERTLVITSDALYNISKKEMRRRVNLDKISGLTKTIPPSKSLLEFTIHISDGDDLRYITCKKELVIDAIKRLFYIRNGKNLAIFCVGAKSLSEFTTTERDFKNGRSRFPAPEYRNFGQDLVKDNSADLRPPSAMLSTFNDGKSGGSVDCESISSSDDFIEKNADIRKQEVEQNKNSAQPSTDETEIMSETQAQGVFSRSKQEAKFTDFKIVKMVGRGSFGKVYMVEQVSQPGRFFAMKSIRKDLILEKNQLESITVEKEILFQIDHPFLVNMEYVFQTNFRIYFLLKFVEGGELFRHLVAEKRFSEETVKFFGLQVALALEHLHERNIIYRDMKPENILVGNDGKHLYAESAT